MKGKPTNEARIDLRLTRAHKELIVNAAAAAGQSVSEFAKSTLITHAQQALQEATIRKLSRRDRDAFLKLLDADARPNTALRKAAARYKRGG